MPDSTALLSDAAIAVESFRHAGTGYSSLDDERLLEAQFAYSALQQLALPHGAEIAAEIARRSRHELGFAGLAKREGFVDPEALIQSISGATRAETVKLVRVGEMMADVADAAVLAEVAPELSGPTPWQQPVTAALLAGKITLDAANSIRRGLGGVDAAVSPDELRDAAAVLVGESVHLDADRLYRRARELRDELDSAGIARRQKERHDDRYFSAKLQPNGMVTGSFALADEAGALMLAIYERSTSPKRGGPRFVEEGEAAKAAAVAEDLRTPGQLAADDIAALLEIGVDADPNVALGHRRPSVRIVVSERTLREQAGSGYLEGSPDPVSLETIERQLCSTGTVGVKFDDDGQCVNVGRDQRLFTQRQRIGLAVRDGGCRFPDCERPPSWCEAHHIDYWHRDDGRTDIADGILLCRNHHMLIHDNHWTIERQAKPDEGTQYWLTPPPGLNKAQRPYLMPSKSRVMRERREVLPRG
ncbi:HNH endonuclease signature motif containing protein [soil metagenome]